MMIKNIVFDMGNVLIRFDPVFYAEFYTDSGEDRDLLLDEVLRSVEWVRLDRGSITYEQAVQSVCARLPQRLHSNARNIICDWFRGTGCREIPSMEELILELKQNGYGVYLLSNVGKAYHEFSKNIPACRHLDGEFISSDWQLLKPDEAIYRTFCTHFSVEPGSCFFVDDIPLNIEGAMNIGMEGFIFRGDVDRLRGALRESGVHVSLKSASTV